VCPPLAKFGEASTKLGTEADQKVRVDRLAPAERDLHRLAPHRERRYRANEGSIQLGDVG
jgi:hypothetical protein